MDSTMKNNEELAIEKQRTKTEKAKQGKGKIIISAIVISFLLLICTACASWLLAIFMPENVEKAISIFIK